MKDVHLFSAEKRTSITSAAQRSSSSTRYPGEASHMNDAAAAAGNKKNKFPVGNEQGSQGTIIKVYSLLRCACGRVVRVSLVNVSSTNSWFWTFNVRVFDDVLLFPSARARFKNFKFFFEKDKLQQQSRK